MSGISISGNKNKATQRLCSALSTYMFEQEYGELRKFSAAEIKVLRDAQVILVNHLNK